MKCKVLLHPNFIIATEGIVVKGFGRGSKDLGIKTANYANDLVEQLPKDLRNGVYYGWAQIKDGPIYKCVVNVGWCPYYHNERKSFETHIMKYCGSDFYGALLRVILAGYLRPEMDFQNLESLIEMISGDIKMANEALESPSNLNVKDSYHELFQSPN